MTSPFTRITLSVPYAVVYAQLADLAILLCPKVYTRSYKVKLDVARCSLLTATTLKRDNFTVFARFQNKDFHEFIHLLKSRPLQKEFIQQTPHCQTTVTLNLTASEKKDGK